jgi:tRNA dimethylallyltransferase
MAERELQVQAESEQIPLVVIVGPTAVGKTALAVALAQHFAAEAVSADSRQFYRGMDIGTAKPTPEECAALRHHLIDIADPDATVSLAQFLQLARAAIADIHRRGKLPLLVGGTGQYVRALLQGWQTPDVPPDPELRAELERRARTDPAGLWVQLLALDPGVADFIDPRNLRRVVRALEVCLKTGIPFSAQRQRLAPPYQVLQFGLTLEREALYARADARVAAMIAAGLPAEVERLLAAGYGWELPAMSGLGYIQFRPYFEGRATLAEVVLRIQLDTHDFIRRQYTWFGIKDAAITWFSPGDTATVCECIAQNTP